MSSAVHDLQKAIVSGQQPLTQLLRQTKLIAAKLGLEEVERWVDLELGGYSKDAEVPTYREFVTQSLQIHNPYQGGWRFAGNLSITLKASQPISEIEELSQGQQIVCPVSENLPIQDLMGTGLLSDFPQRFTTAGSQFKRIVQAVTDELLRWTTELEKRGILGEDMDFDEKEKQSATNQVFNIQKFTGVLGNVQNSQVTLYDYSSVQQLLIDHKIPKADRRELEDIMDDLKDAPPEKKPSLMARAEKWIVKHKELLGAGAEAVGKAIGTAIGKH
jgi:hypothetical protein